jgi:hypothetical protein
MILALDLPLGSKQVSKYFKLDATEALARDRRGANRAVVFDKDELTARQLFAPSHIALARPDVGKGPQLFRDIRVAGQSIPIARRDLARPVLQQPDKRLFTEFAADAPDQIDGELGVRVGE